eukprot:TRINITY_DN4200_c0_g1_i1.p1 TRINITY_DN4200_c0_g1~~TRINITY_DN4200_c0_g1_i1.p1  ORF type:complete len:488 (+),score=108.74 TRINITY_DN4200_c0_g1_i1:121-1584(+)
MKQSFIFDNPFPSTPPASSTSSMNPAARHNFKQTDSHSESGLFSHLSHQWETVSYYSKTLKHLSSFAQAIDRCSPRCREMVWNRIWYQYNQPPRGYDLFSPIIEGWCSSSSMDLVAVETMYSAFVHCCENFPPLLEEMQSNAVVPLPINTKPAEKEERKNNTNITTSLIWDSQFTSAIQQFSLLLSWAQLLERLPPNQKEAIWNTCQFFPLFSETDFDRTSFRKTFYQWANNPAKYATHITVAFSAIGFLRDKGVIKHQFFYPNTNTPVFTNGVRSYSPRTYTPSPIPASSSTSSVEPSPLSKRATISPTPLLPSSLSCTPLPPPSPPVESPRLAPRHTPSPSLSASPSKEIFGPSPGTITLPPLNSLSPRQQLPQPAPQPQPQQPTQQPTQPTLPKLHMRSSPPPSQLGLLAMAASEMDEPSVASSKVDPPTLSPLSWDIKPDFASKKETSPPQMKILKRKTPPELDAEEMNKKPRAMNLSHILCS